MNSCDYCGDHLDLHDSLSSAFTMKHNSYDLGAGHGLADFVQGAFHAYHQSFAHYGAGIMDLSFDQTRGALGSVDQIYQDISAWTDQAIPNFLGANASDSFYQYARTGTNLGLTAFSVGTGAYSLAKGGLSLLTQGFRWLKSTRGFLKNSRNSVPSINKVETYVNRGASLAGSKRSPLEQVYYQQNRNPPGIINGRNYTGHALDKMQDRGIMPSVVENAITFGHSVKDSKGATLYFDTINNIKVVLGENGQVITTYPLKQRIS